MPGAGADCLTRVAAYRFLVQDPMGRLLRFAGRCRAVRDHITVKTGQIVIGEDDYGGLSKMRGVSSWTLLMRSNSRAFLQERPSLDPDFLRACQRTVCTFRLEQLQAMGSALNLLS